MLYRFKSKACADLVMLEADGRRMAQILTGQPDSPKGIVQVHDLAQALARLEASVQDDEARRSAQSEDSRAQSDAESALPAVRWAQRAAPMLHMLRTSLREEADVVWGV